MFKGLFDFKGQYFRIRWKIVSPVIFFIFISLLILSSTSTSDVFFQSTFYKQILWFSIGCIAFYIVQYVRIQYLYDYSYLFYSYLFIDVYFFFSSEPLHPRHELSLKLSGDHFSHCF